MVKECIETGRTVDEALDNACLKLGFSRDEVQFEIIDLGIVGSCEFTNNRKMEILDKNGNGTGKFTYNAKGTLYRKFNPNKDKVPAFKDADTGELYSSIYARVLIKRKK